MSMPLTSAPTGAAPEGITNPPIDDLLGPREKPLAIAMREIQAGLLEHTEGGE